MKLDLEVSSALNKHFQSHFPEVTTEGMIVTVSASFLHLPGWRYFLVKLSGFRKPVRTLHLFQM